MIKILAPERLINMSRDLSVISNRQTQRDRLLVLPQLKCSLGSTSASVRIMAPTFPIVTFVAQKIFMFETSRVWLCCSVQQFPQKLAQFPQAAIFGAMFFKESQLESHFRE